VLVNTKTNFVFFSCLCAKNDQTDITDLPFNNICYCVVYGTVVLVL